MKLKKLLLIFFLLPISCMAKKESDFEKMLAGFPQCIFENVYVDYGTQEPQHKYFKDRKMKPYKVENGAAYFNVDEHFHGLHVTQTFISAGYDVVAIIFDEPISSVEIKLKSFLRHGYNGNWPAGGEVLLPSPSLKADKTSPNHTILFCDFEANY
ncbi:MAG: hypothetical protein V4660_13775 [Pseudomonadota bacterium]